MQEEQHKLSPGSRIVSFTLLGSDQRGLWDWYPRDTVEGALGVSGPRASSVCR